MKELAADLWEVDAALRVITTNGTVKTNGKAVMGRGCAAEARKRYIGIATKLGRWIREYGNVPYFIYQGLATLPVKHQWWEKADPDLIVKSVRILAQEARMYGYTSVVMPRPGCGNGGLAWEDVKPLIEPYLDNRFTVVHYPEEA
jgi:hypothetical protein